MRQESAFACNAPLACTAMGLWSADAGNRIASPGKCSTLQTTGRSELLEPDTNIALGSAYEQMEGELGDSAVLATAASNAEPHRITLAAGADTAGRHLDRAGAVDKPAVTCGACSPTVIYENAWARPTRLNNARPVPPVSAFWAARRVTHR